MTMKQNPLLLSRPDVSIKKAWQQLSDNGFRVLFIVDDQNRLMGCVTDGDVRRWVLQDHSLAENISRIMVVNPVVALESDDKKTIQRKLLDYRIECIPVINQNKQIQKVIFWADLFKNGESVSIETIDVPVVIVAGGRGERLTPFTKILPKPLIPIGEKPVIEVIMDKFHRFGVVDFHLTVNYKANMIRAYFQDTEHNFNIHYYEETYPSGTVGSLSLLRDKIHSTFIMSNADIIVDADYADIIKFHRKNKNKITLVCSMKHFPIPYGVVQITNGGELKGIQEKPEFDHLVLTGVYVMEPELIHAVPTGQFFHMTHLLENLRREGAKIGVYPVAEKMWMDVGEMKAYEETLKRFDQSRYF